jgi:plastocyanin
MKRTALLSILLAAVSWACGEAPEAPAQETPPAREGVSGRAPATTQGIPSVVSLRLSSGGPAAAPSEAALLDQLGLAFTPQQILVRAGQQIDVVNSESLAHNVHISFIDNDSTVIIEDMGPAERTQIVLSQEGGYDVACDVHPGMRAFIYVTSETHAAFADPEGIFLIPDVPPGSYTASVWSASAGLRGERTIEVSGPRTELDLTTFP